MNSCFPDADTIRSALLLAVRAPSVHNSQPWRWRIGRDRLDLFADRELHLQHTDPDGRDLTLSCGVVLNHCQVAFAALGWRAKIDRLPETAKPNHLAAITFQAQSATDADITLAAAITRRRTDRRPFGSWHVPAGDVALMGARAARAGVTMRRVADLPQLRRSVVEAAWRHGTDVDYAAELATWSGRHGATAGVPASNTPTPHFAEGIPARCFAGPALAAAPVREAADNAMVIALGTAADDEVSRLRAGEVTSLLLLTATALGLASCPITEPLEVPETRATLRSDVFDDRSEPQMLLRIGWSPMHSDPLPATPRRPLAEVATWSTEGSFR